MKPIRHAFHLGRTIGQNAQRLLSDESVERRFPPPDQPMGLRRIDEHLAENLLGRTTNQRAKQSVGQRFAGSHGHDHIVLRLTGQQFQGLDPERRGGGLCRKISDSIDGVGILFPYVALPEGHVSQDSRLAGRNVHDCTLSGLLKSCTILP